MPVRVRLRAVSGELRELEIVIGVMGIPSCVRFRHPATT
jgi:hypothetical protein